MNQLVIKEVTPNPDQSQRCGCGAVLARRATGVRSPGKQTVEIFYWCLDCDVVRAKEKKSH